MTEKTNVDEHSASPHCSTNHMAGPWRQGGTTELMLNRKCREIVSDEGKVGLVFGIDDSCNKANARLIAAAPDLLAALEEITNLRFGWGGDCGAVKIADAAIAAATET